MRFFLLNGVKDVVNIHQLFMLFTENNLFQLQEGVGQKYPVMFYIHGGDFIHGASNFFPGHILATFYKVVVVTINYRLGALGT